MKSIETEGKNVEQAIELGLYKLGLKREEVTIQILDQGGLFSKAKVKISTGEQSEDEKQIKKIFDEFILSTGLSCFASVEEKDGAFFVNLTGNDIGVLIGKHGDVLASIQLLFSQILNKGEGSYKKIVVDSSNYISRREETLKILARNMANRAIREKKPVKLEYMSAKERRIIHTELADNPRVSTLSSGEEPKRYVVISPVKKEKKQDDFSQMFNVASRENND